MGGPANEPWAAAVETHSGAVYFAGDCAFKVKKPLDFGFVDYRTVTQRAAACHREVELNRRLAPDVYLGVAELGAPGRTAEPVVVMRRMPAQARLTTWVGEGRPDLPDRLREVARAMAVFHERCPVHDEDDSPGSPDNVRLLWQRELAGFASVDAAARRPGAPAEQARITRLVERYLSGRRPLFADRLASGRVRDGHGDLLADDVFLLPDGPRILDCLEFDERLRIGDVLLDIAFLAMDLERLGDAAAARRFLDDYREFSAETHPPSLEDFYIAYRAHVRAKVMWIRAGQGNREAALQAEQLGALCLRRLERATVKLIVIGGLPGAGKTSVGAALADRLAAAMLSSDVTRKQRAGVPLEPGPGDPYGAGLYAPAVTEQTYATLLQQSEAALAYGESVVLDASWHDADWRAQARAVAARTGAVLVELACTAPDEVAESRLGARHGGPSDADAGIRRRMAGEFAPWPEAHVVPTGGEALNAVGLAEIAVAEAVDRVAQSPLA